MNVAELISKLQQFDTNMTVVVQGYESGYDNPVITKSNVILNANWNGQQKNTWYSGQHEHDYYDNTKPTTTAIVIGR